MVSMLPSFTVPKSPARPRNELRFENVAFWLPVSSSTDCSICQIPFNPVLPNFLSPRKPRYEFCESTALRGPAVVPLQLPALAVVPQSPVVGDASVDTDAPVSVAPELVARMTCGESLPENWTGPMGWLAITIWAGPAGATKSAPTATATAFLFISPSSRRCSFMRNIDLEHGTNAQETTSDASCRQVHARYSWP